MPKPTHSSISIFKWMDKLHLIMKDATFYYIKIIISLNIIKKIFHQPRNHIIPGGNMLYFFTLNNPNLFLSKFPRIIY